MLDRPGQPLATRDGVTVAKEVSDLPDPFENMGAAYAREVADAAVTEAGDGTTTASVILQAIVTEGMNLVSAGAEPLLLADGIQAAADACAATIKASAIKATPELVKQVAIISTHGDVELGSLIAEATLKVGERGVVELNESRDHTTTVEYLEGFYFERGWRGVPRSRRRPSCFGWTGVRSGELPPRGCWRWRWGRRPVAASRRAMPVPTSRTPRPIRNRWRLPARRPWPMPSATPEPLR